jgi:tetratricopeptide (TPR) repeat protein
LQRQVVDIAYILDMKSLLFVLMLGEPSGLEKIGGLIAPILSACAFILSSAAFIFTVIIQLKERKRNIRQTLATALSEIANINVEITKVRKDNEIGFELTKIWKNYIRQCGALASDAHFLIKENEKLVTDIDCGLIASTYEDVGNTDKAAHYWLKAIDLAPTNLQKYVHKCDYASFLFENNQIEKARKEFESALKLKLPDTDYNYGQLADSYLTWAKLELNFDNKTESKRLLKEATTHSKLIKHKDRREDMAKLIDVFIKSKLD